MSARSRHRLSAAVFIVLKQGDAVCLLRRAGTGWMDGYMSLPAGGLEASETLLEAAIREAREEVGIALEPHELHYAHTLHCLTEGNDWLGHFFVSTQWIGDPKICEADKHDGLAWVAIPDLPRDMIPYVRQGLICIERRQPYSEYGWKEAEPLAN